MEAQSSPEVKNFMWRLARGVLSTCNNLNMMHVFVEDLCSFCHNHPETDSHLFIDCLYAKDYWYRSSVSYYHGTTSTIVDWLISMLRKGDDLFRGRVAIVLWQIWRSRMIFYGRASG